MWGEKIKQKDYEAILEGKEKIQYKVGEIIFNIDKNYKITEKIGKGAYGQVVKAIDTQETDPELMNCAIKKVDGIFENELTAKFCLRELKILRLLEHKNIVGIKEIMLPETYNFQCIYAVSDLMESDLGDIIKSDQPLEHKHIKFFMQQILRGVKHMHDANIIHRDLKPKNLLVNENCNIKICDFGLSRTLLDGFDKKYLTGYTVTRWYRPPEILLNWDGYDKSVDTWSIGCIFAELLDRKVLFPGNNSEEQLELILTILGTPSKDDLIKMDKEIYTEKIYKHGKLSKIPWKDVISNHNDDAFDLLEKFLKFDPLKRISLDDALKHKYFDGMSEIVEEKPEPVTKFDFEFEDLTTLSIQDYRNFILQEILLYHDNNLLNDYDKAKEIYKKELNYKKKMHKSSSNKSHLSKKSSSSSTSKASKKGSN